MAEGFSEKEVERLINKSDKNLSQDKGPIPYDFRLPNRISKNQLKILRSIHETLSDSFGSYLVSKLQTMLNVKVTAVDQIYYSEYILAVPSPACLYTFKLKNTDIKGLLELNVDLALNLVERLLGGSGTGKKESKVITAIEQKVLEDVTSHLMNDLKDAWQAIDDFEFVIDRFEADIDFAQITSQSESVLLISFDISIGEQSYPMNICFATYAFDTILSKLSVQKLSSIRPAIYDGYTSRELLTLHLQEALLPIVVEFGRSKITVKELLELNEGDVIRLQTKITDEQIIKVSSETFFYGRVGILNDHKAIKITRKLKSNKNNLQV
ncbi:MAG: flagellar motor switch protein FliM [Bacteroidetes bacterium]|nr:flagellar motor switch protein FliM [Bacteroidota bacterium]